MKLTTSLLIFALAASASAQQKPANQPVPVKPGSVQLKMTPVKPAASTKAAPASTKTAAKPAPATGKPAAVAVKPLPPPTQKAAMVPVKPVHPVARKHAMAPKAAVHHVKKTAPKPAAPVAAVKQPEKPAETGTADFEKTAASTRGKRDPFETIIRERALTGACAGGGKQCLIPDEVALKGIVRSNGAIIAVVTTKENRAYFLRENDPVLNGVVTKITEESITFRERTTDIFGKQVMREVVKKINNTRA